MRCVRALRAAGPGGSGWGPGLAGSREAREGFGMLPKGMAREMLRQGTAHALKELGVGETGRALAALGYWDELRKLAERAESWRDDTFLDAALADPGTAALETVQRAGGGEALERAARVRPEEAGLLLAWAQDQREPVGPELMRAAGTEMAKLGQWDRLAKTLAEHPATAGKLDTAAACEWVAKAPQSARGALSKALGGRDGRLAGAEAAGLLLAGDKRWKAVLNALPEDQRSGALTRCLRCLATLGSSAAAAGVAGEAVFGWAAENNVEANDKAVGMLCLRLGRAGELEGIQRLIALVPRPSAMCYEAVVSCLAFRGDFVGATRVAEHVVAAGLAPSYLFFRDLLNCLEGRSEQLAVFSQAHAAVGRFDTPSYNRWLAGLLKHGRWQEAIAVFSEHMRRPDVVTYVTLVSGLSQLDRSAEALEFAMRMMEDSHIVANSHAFTALRSLCRAHGHERLWPKMRAWAAGHGVPVGDPDSSWRDEALDPRAENAARLKYPR